jgi:hypothetical protein
MNNPLRTAFRFVSDEAQRNKSIPIAQTKETRWPAPLPPPRAGVLVSTQDAPSPRPLERPGPSSRILQRTRPPLISAWRERRRLAAVPVRTSSQPDTDNPVTMAKVTGAELLRALRAEGHACQAPARSPRLMAASGEAAHEGASCRGADAGHVGYRAESCGDRRAGGRCWRGRGHGVSQAAASGYDDDLSGVDQLDPGALGHGIDRLAELVRRKKVHLFCGSLVPCQGAWCNAAIYLSPAGTGGPTRRSTWPPASAAGCKPGPSWRCSRLIWRADR